MAALWRKNEDDAKKDGERQKGEVVMMDNDNKEKLETEEHVQVPKRMYITREDQEGFGFTARCPGCMSLHKGTSRQVQTENVRRRIEEELCEGGGSTKAREGISGQRNRDGNETKSIREDGQQQQQQQLQ